MLVAWSPILSGSVPSRPLGLHLGVSLEEVTRHLMVPCCMLSCYLGTYYHGFLSMASTQPEFYLVTSFIISIFTDSRFYVYMQIERISIPDFES